MIEGSNWWDHLFAQCYFVLVLLTNMICLNFLPSGLETNVWDFFYGIIMEMIFEVCGERSMTGQKWSSDTKHSFYSLLVLNCWLVSWFLGWFVGWLAVVDWLVGMLVQTWWHQVNITFLDRLFPPRVNSVSQRAWGCFLSLWLQDINFPPFLYLESS